MEEVRREGTVEVLERLHREFDLHFRHLYEVRQRLTSAAPVFALEHGLYDTDLELLKKTVRSAVSQGFGAPFRRWWLPFVVYAAESGYDYAGEEYWQTFVKTTPWWHEYGDRNRIRAWFKKFADEYGGAVPRGAFAAWFPIIAWPITHAVLPVYLQRNLAHLLFEFRTGLTTQLLHDPHALGTRLAARTGSYTERFRLFCENATLLGHVAAALLSGEDEESPYLLRSTLRRLVDGLSRERESQLWLESARHSASQVRARGFRPQPKRPSGHSRRERLPAPTDPRLLLRHAGSGWQAFAELPDLSFLTGRLPHLCEELRTCRPQVAGAERGVLPRGQLLFPGRQVRLARWPQPDVPFIQLERGSVPVNRLLAEQCVVGRGPAWLFRCRVPGLAVEVKGKTVRPGSAYVLVLNDATAAPGVPWVTETAIQVDGVHAFSIAVPGTLSESDRAGLEGVGLSVISNVAIRPVGIVASNWDGEGSVEWVAGEPGMIGIHAESAPQACVVQLDDASYTMQWPAQKPELLLALDDMSVGTSELSVTLLDEDDKKLAEGFLVVTVRDPQARPDSAAPGEGIRMLVAPARPTLSDLWDDRAVISVDGPPSKPATLAVTLRSGDGAQVSEIRRSVALPVTPEQWSRIARLIRNDHQFRSTYDDAESAEVVVYRSGIGFASLTCDRGFQPLRWRIIRLHDGGHAARLIDQTDGARTTVELFKVVAPLMSIPCAHPARISVPVQGGLLRAAAGDAKTTILLPTEPNEIIRLGKVRPVVTTGSRAPQEVLRLACAHQMWATAEQPADPFARRQLDTVLDAITTALVSMVAGSRWANLENRMKNARDPASYLNEMERCVGDTGSHRDLAQKIGRSLWKWATRQALLCGFADIAARMIGSSTVVRHPSTAKFLLTLADQPGRITVEWSQAERNELIIKALSCPVLLRAARFAVLGARALGGSGDAGGEAS